MNTEIDRVLRGCLGVEALSTRPIAGGDIAASFEVLLPEGRRYFAKSYGNDSPGIAQREADGLRWLAEAGALRTPDVIAVHSPGPDVLVLEWIESAPAACDLHEAFGRGLAALHRFHPAGFGLAEDNFIGRLPQSNRHRDDWARFYAECRIAPQIRMARDRGRISKALQVRAEAVMGRMPDLCGPAERPARLHGDLWGGNWMIDDRGSACLIDPAVYGGHREVDLAMMKLFGGFDDRVFAAYDEAHPLAAGWRDRIPLYQLYPLLVHVNLFGGSYTASVERALAHYG